MNKFTWAADDIEIEEEELPDLRDLAELDADWTDERLMRFAEFMGYSIQPSETSSLGFKVVGPSGKTLGGFVARRIIEAWQRGDEQEMSKNLKSIKDAKASAAKKGGAGKKGGGAAKVDPKLKAAEALAKKKADAEYSISGIDADDMALRSKGKLRAGDIKDFIAAARAKIEATDDPKTVAQALKEMKRDISDYKREMTRPPSQDVQLKDTVARLKQNLPDAGALAGVSFDPRAIQQIIDRHAKRMDAAGSEADARAAVKEMRKDISVYKVAEAKRKAEEKKAVAEQRTLTRDAKKNAATAALQAASGQLRPAPQSLPKTASEWAAWYTDAWLFSDQPGAGDVHVDSYIKVCPDPTCAKERGHRGACGGLPLTNGEWFRRRDARD